MSILEWDASGDLEVPPFQAKLGEIRPSGCCS